MKKSIRQIMGLAAAEPVRAERETAREAAGEETPRVSAAERLGLALLESIGGVEGVSEDELVDALLENRKKGVHASGRAKEDEAAEHAQTELPNGVRESGRIEEAAGDPAYLGAGVWEDHPMPVPMRTGSGSTEPVDYSTMSAEQFARLRKLLKKASADGKRIKL